MNLILDIGNTRTKIAIFDGELLISYAAFTEISIQQVKDWVEKEGSVQQVIVSVTGSFADELKEWLQSNFSCFVQMSAELDFPFHIRYSTKSTLGNDRIAGIAGAQSLFPGHDCLVIDAGTAITYDFIDHEGIYWGGNISPGISMRFQALHTFTRKLPLIQQAGEIPTMGFSTETAIRSGVVLGVIYEIDQYIREFTS
ncbi:MAG: type III pantothenate kinase, partial [Bacteroidales bacterium]